MEVVAGFGGVIAVVLIVLAVVGVVVTLVRNYHTVAPNQVAIISGRQRKVQAAGVEGVQRRGYRVVTGGGFLLWPVLEKVQYMSLNVMTFALDVLNAPDQNGVPVTVKAIANVKVLSDEGALSLAVERFLGYRQEQIQSFAKENLESNLRAIVGTLTIEQLIKDRQNLQTAVMREAHGDLAKLGLGVDLLNIQEVRDDKGYIQALGQARAAEVRKNADIGAAEAVRDTKIRTADAEREGNVRAAEAALVTSNAERERDMAKAANLAQVQAAQARISIVAEIAAQEEQARLNEAEVRAQMVRTERETELQELVRKKEEKRLQATTIVQAEATKQARLIAADAEQQAAEREGEALRIKAEKEGLGEQARQEGEAKGRIATANALRAEKEAEAAGQQAALVAAAEGERRLQLARAEGTKAQLLAEATGALEKARAFKELDEAGRFLMILQASPATILAIGQAFAAGLTPLGDAIGAGLGNIKSLTITDLAGGKDNKAVLTDFANLPVEVVTNLVQQAKAAGLDKAIGAVADRYLSNGSPKGEQPGA